MKSATRNSVLLFFGAVLFHLAGTWSLPLIDRDEPRFSEASREMIQRGDYFVPYFNNHLRLDKPPLTYWAQVASYKIFGESDFSARFPSAIAAALTALVIFTWGSRIRLLQPGSTSQASADGAKPGWWAAIIFTLSLQTFLHAKAAVADMWLVLFMTLGYWAGYELLQLSVSNSQEAQAGTQRSTRHIRQLWWWTFYLSLALGFLAKGPIAWIPLLSVVTATAWRRDWRLNRNFKFLPGIVVALAIVALWGVPALMQTHGEFFAVGIGRHVVERSLATMEGHGASSFGMYVLLLPFYFVTIFLSFFPWSIKLPWLLNKLLHKQKTGINEAGHDQRDTIDNYLLTGIGIVFAVFTLVATKLPHYTLPAFPLLALLLARHWQGVAATKIRVPLFRTIAVTTAVVWIAIALLIPPLAAKFFPAYDLFQESRADLQPNMQFASVEFEEPSLVWYFRSRIKTFLTRLNKKNAVKFMSAPGPRFVILPTSLAQGLFSSYPPGWKVFSTQGFNIPKGKKVELTLMLKPE